MTSNSEEQECRAFLRERYLKLLSKLCGGVDCSIAMHENTNVTCRVKAFDNDFENIIVENLTTPLPTTINKAILRTNDIVSIKFHCDYKKLIE